MTCQEKIDSIELHEHWTETFVNTRSSTIQRHLQERGYNPWIRNGVKNVLSGLRRKRPGQLLCSPRLEFQMNVNLTWKSKFSSRGRVDRFWIQGQVFCSLVWSFCSGWWVHLSHHLLVLVVVGQQVFYQVQSQWSCLLEHFLLPSPDKFYKDTDYLFQLCFPPAHSAKTTTKRFADDVNTVLDWPANSPDLEPHRDSMDCCQD